MMRKKLSGKRGFSLAELLVTIVILVMVGAAVAVGISAAMQTHRDVTLKTEASMLCSMLSVEIADEIRFGKNYGINSVSGNLVYDSSRFGDEVELGVVGGYITIGGKPLLSGKTYTSFRADIVAEIVDPQVSIDIIIFYNGNEIASNNLLIIPLSSQ